MAKIKFFLRANDIFRDQRNTVGGKMKIIDIADKT